MLTLRDLAPVLTAARAVDGPEGPDAVIGALAATGWDESIDEARARTEERSWRHAGPPNGRPFGGSAWVSDQYGRISVGIIVEAVSSETARELHDAIHNQIISDSRLVAIASDKVWSNWSDGHQIVRLALHDSPAQDGQPLPPTVQVSFEPADSTEPEV